MPHPGTFMVLVSEFLVQANETAIRDHFGAPGHVFGDAFHAECTAPTAQLSPVAEEDQGDFRPPGASEGSHYITEKKE